MVLEWPTPGDHQLIHDMVALADRNRATLGPMPRGAFAEFAAQRTLLVAVTEDGRLAGYALFAVARSRIRLIHLCVDESNRGQGVAASLVNAISSSYAHLSGIRVRCRPDYAAQSLWPVLGFSAVNETVGRGKSQTPLTVWWKSHNLPDLFSSEPQEDMGLTVAIDHNVFIDLAIERTRLGAAESQALEADWLSGQLRLAVTLETYNEIMRLPSRADREKQRKEAARFAQLPSNAVRYSAAIQDLKNELGWIDPRDTSDLRHVAHAAAGGASVFVSRDSRWIDTVRDAASRVLDIRVLRPSDIVTHLEELKHAENYRPAALRGTGYTVQEAGPGVESFWGELIDRPGGERRISYQSLLRRLSANPGITLRDVRNTAGAPVVAWATSDRAPIDAIEVPFLRTSRDNLAPTVMRLVLAELRSLALDLGVTRIRVADGHITPIVRQALDETGFLRFRLGFEAAVVDVDSIEEAIAVLGPEHPYSAELRLATTGADAAQRAALLEQYLWPAKLLDSAVKSYVIPIQPRFARELFGLQDGLWDRAAILGMSREHVYYRTPRGNPAAPSRVLWYASGSGRDRIGSIVACSQLVEVVTAPPEELFRRFRHLGVYRLADIQSRCRNGVASALRFVDTERLSHPVTLERLRALTQNRRLGSLQSPTMVETELFQQVYREGVRRRAR